MSTDTVEIPRCVVVTGVARVNGIGAAIAVALLNAGYAVCGMDHIQLEVSHLKQRHPLRQLGQGNERFMFIHDWNSGDKESSEIAVEKVTVFSRHKLMGLVNCSGIPQPYMPNVSDINARWEHFQNVIQVDLSGVFLLTELLIPHMIRCESSIIHISSTRAHQSEPNCEAYGSSKAGLIGLTHCQAISFASRGIRVNAILPGWIETSGNYEPTEREMIWHPVGRVGSPDDIAELCLFLLDEKKSGFINGQEFIVDGGVSKKMLYPEQ